MNPARNLAQALRRGLVPFLLSGLAGAAVTVIGTFAMALGIVNGAVATLVVLAVTPQVVVAATRALGGGFGTAVVSGLLAGAIGGGVLGWVDYTPCTERSQLPGFACASRIDAARIAAGLFAALNGMVAAISARLVGLR